MPTRTLSDSDVRAIASQVNAQLDLDDLAEKVEARMVERFQLETGRAFWVTVKKWWFRVLFSLALMIAAANWNTTRPFVEAILKGTKL